MTETTIGKKMIAPKIHGHSMQEVEFINNCGHWTASYNNSQLIINTLMEREHSDCSIYLNGCLIFESAINVVCTPQEATDKAVAWLNQLSNLLKNLGFGLT